LKSQRICIENEKSKIGVNREARPGELIKTYSDLEQNKWRI
jgi:hypothetical protein